MVFGFPLNALLLYIQTPGRKCCTVRQTLFCRYKRQSLSELGLDEELYDTLISDWKRTCTEVMRLKGENNWRVYKYDVILFGGSIGKFYKIEYGEEFKLQLEESAYKVSSSDEVRYQYLAVYIRSEFNDWIPQD